MRDDGERLADILDAAEKIRRKVTEGREAFDADEYAQLAIVHLVQIIGEAANRLSPELTGAHPEIPWRQIVATRNRVVHSYFDVDIELLWSVASVDIPKLEEQLRAF
ncbi:HepT-like ribonuclease domain-containing protein [Glycomyces dulcitolivorans]|uniref:HepT-like ribonuclease domain-containing protein n=1 Tax=Glycomyces dulcitolivorans TaxID=2200759 RepID=UPI000DD3B070|nr:HepT-like ribonuclease domain-containing protein [Glycomyces dulcitolivorans]